MKMYNIVTLGNKWHEFYKSIKTDSVYNTVIFLQCRKALYVSVSNVELINKSEPSWNFCVIVIFLFLNQTLERLRWLKEKILIKRVINLMSSARSYFDIALFVWLCKPEVSIKLFFFLILFYFLELIYYLT